MEKLSNIGLGNFCKAILEHKHIKIYSDKYHVIYIFSWFENNGAYYCAVDKEYWLDFEIINVFLKDIYKLDYTFEILE